MQFKTAATEWGCSHEKLAREAYGKAVREEHENFKIFDVGFVINPLYPIFGASPDGGCSCDCCGEGVIEVKCPYCGQLDDFTSSSASCLEESDDGLKLKKGHKYFYQVQAQIYICQRDYCDFVVWTKKEVHIERIKPYRESYGMKW